MEVVFRHYVLLKKCDSNYKWSNVFLGNYCGDWKYLQATCSMLL